MSFRALRTVDHGQPSGNVDVLFTYIIISEDISSRFAICIAKLEFFHRAISAVSLKMVSFSLFCGHFDEIVTYLGYSMDRE